MSLEKNFGHAAGPGPLADERNSGLERKLRNARDVAAVDAQKVRVVRLAFFRLPQLETPDMVAQLQSVQQTDVRQLDEIAIDRCPVEPLGHKLVGHLRMGHRPARPEKMTKDAQPSRSAA